MSGNQDAAVGRLPLGFVIDERYQVANLIGRGGSGLIFGARDLRTNQGVAIKTLNADVLSHPSAVARYHREARAAAGIGHPNICAVLDAGQLTDGRPYLVMELLSGRTLSARIKEGRSSALHASAHDLDPNPFGLGGSPRQEDRPSGHQAGQRVPVRSHQGCGGGQATGLWNRQVPRRETPSSR